MFFYAIFRFCPIPGVMDMQLLLARTDSVISLMCRCSVKNRNLTSSLSEAVSLCLRPFLLYNTLFFCLFVAHQLHPIRYHNVGILVLFLHDINDIQLEFTKLNVYLKSRGGGYYLLNDVLSNMGSVSFSITW